MYTKRCNRCGGPITFHRNASGKLVPTELDGSEHWDICKRRRHERLTPAARARLPATKTPQTTCPAPEVTHIWSGDLPPWDGSLGEFRNFTPEEMAAGEVCSPLDRG